MTSAMLQQAIEYHRLGLSVIRIRPGTKKPVGKWKPYQSERASEGELRKWFGNGSQCGIGIVFGTVSGGVVCRDFDEVVAYERWAAEHPQLAAMLPTVKTARGRHVWCRGDVAAIRRSSKSGGGIIVYTDGELRSDGAYCVVPPTMHPDGVPYEWVIPPTNKIPLVDLFDAGFLDSGACNREDRDDRDDRDSRVNRANRETERTEITENTGRCLLLSQSSTLSLSQEIQQAIERTRPDGLHKRHTLLFHFARHLKSIPSLADVPVNELRLYVQKWYDSAKPFIRSPFEETWFDFGEAWDKIRFPVGQGPVDMAFAMVLASELPEVADQYEQQELRLLVGLCRELQRAAGADSPFFLASRVAARLLQVDHSTAARWLKGLQLDGIIQLVEAGSSSSGKASRYRYIADDKRRS
jgi:Bifunctional DNA primase/polymerase, N-terminal